MADLFFCRYSHFLSDVLSQVQIGHIKSHLIPHHELRPALQTKDPTHTADLPATLQSTKCAATIDRLQTRSLQAACRYFCSRTGKWPHIHIMHPCPCPSATSGRPYLRLAVRVDRRQVSLLLVIFEIRARLYKMLDFSGMSDTLTAQPATAMGQQPHELGCIDEKGPCQRGARNLVGTLKQAYHEPHRATHVNISPFNILRPLVVHVVHVVKQDSRATRRATRHPLE